MQTITKIQPVPSPTLFDLSFKDSAAWLIQLTRCATPDGARAYLQGLLGRAQLLNLYRELFPKEFAASKASIEMYTARPYGRSTDDCQLSAREWEFVRLVDQKLFPVDTDMLIEQIYEWEERPDVIPISPLQPYCWNCGDYDPEELHLVFRLALALMGEERERSLLNDYIGHEVAIDKFERFSDAGSDRFEKFEARCKRQKSPMADVPLACRMVAYSSGNSWLDWMCEMPAEFTWDIADIEFLASEYKEASALLTRVYTVDKWLSESPAERLLQAIQIWNGAKKRRKKDDAETEQRRVPLIEIL